MWPILNVFIEFVTILLLFYIFGFFGHKACGILAHWTGIKPTPPALKGEVPTTGLSDRGAWWATVQRVTKSRTQLSMHVACGNQGVLRAWLFFVAVTIRLLNLHVSTPYVHFLISPSWSRFMVMLLSVVKGLFLKHLRSLISRISELVGVSIWLSITSWVTPLLQKEEGLPYTVVTSVCNPGKSWCWVK